MNADAVCTGRRRMVKKSADQGKRLNDGDVSVTCRRLCTGLSPGIGEKVNRRLEFADA
jgi:hypothetical protein